MFGWSAGWLVGTWDLEWMAGRFWTRPHRRGAEVCGNIVQPKFLTLLLIFDHFWLFKMNLLSLWHRRSLLLWPSSSQSSQRSAYWPALWRPLCLCRGERCGPHNCSEPGSGSQCPQRHRESRISHLHQSYWLPQSAQHYRRLQIH